MTGPIKFRGRRVDNGEYVYGDLLSDILFNGLTEDGLNAKLRRVYKIRQNSKWFEVASDSVAQLVGYDSKGKEVYEGDTMTDDDGKPFIVILKPQGCTFREENGRRDYSSLTFELAGRNYIKNFTVKEARL